MKTLKWLGLLSVLAGLFSAVNAVGLSTANSDVIDYCTGPNNSNCVYTLSSGGNVTALGTLNSSGTGTNTLTGSLAVTGKTIYTPTSVTAVATTTVISPAATYLILFSTGGPINLPASGLSAGTNGQYIVLGSTTTNNVILTDGSGMQLGASTRTLNGVKRIGLLYDTLDSQWKELSFGDN